MKPGVRGLLHAAALLAAAFFILGLFGRAHWTLDLLAHFRAQYAAALLAAALALALLKDRKSALACLIGSVVVTATILGSARPLPPAADGPRLKLISYNVHTANRRHDDVEAFLREEDADVVFLMEVNDAWIAALRSVALRYPHRLEATREDNFGLALWSKVPVEGEVKSFGDADIPWVDATLTDSDIRLAAIHPLPPSGAKNAASRNAQLFAVADLVRSYPRTVVCGDLNLTPYSPWFGDLLHRGGLRATAPPFSPTWMRHDPIYAIPIDHVLLGSDLTLTSRRLGPSLGSDHNPLVVEIAGRATDPGR